MLFDSNPVDRLHIEGNAPDPWSRLRREYTGPRFFFHLLLLVAFLVPYATRVLIFSAQSQMYETAERLVEHVENPSGDNSWADMVFPGIERYRETHEKTGAWWVLLGGQKGRLFFGLTVVLIFYNGWRAYLTWKVSALRDAEERSKITPSLVEYYGVFHPLADRRDLLGINRERGAPLEVPSWRDWIPVWRNRARKPIEDPDLDSGYPSLGRSVFHWCWKRPLFRFLWRKWQPLRMISVVPVIGLYRLHHCARVLFWIAFTSFGYNAAVWIYQTKVWVPMP